ncbi:uncharacterized protein LOC126413047 [Schistocerca serialis cubense]|uniref:uncharacterized protein LOC126413047 n=1 Tax=Schistocerca serialis cubense TaxID=2023355 RepID=UPI00214ED9F4|nr:uncharacterized protein LOC126413047 [Schistocerca serialis cubense]
MASRDPDVGAVLGPSATLLRLQGLWTPPGGGRTAATAFAAAVSLALACGLVTMSLLKLLMDRPRELEELVACIFNVTMHGEMLIKLLCFVAQGPTLRELVQLLSEIWKANSSSERSEDIRRRYRRLGDRLFLALVGITSVTAVIWVASPLVHLVVNMDTEASSGNPRPLPLPAWLPLDIYASPTYELLYMMQVLCLIVPSVATVSSDCVFIDLMLRVAAELEILNDNISSLRKMKVSAKSNEYMSSSLASDFEVHLQLSKNVKHHQAILRFV